MDHLLQNLGKLGRDKVTGYKGIITSVSVQLYGCDMYFIKPFATKDNKLEDGGWFDAPRIDIIGKGILPKEVRGSKPGGDSLKPPTRGF